MNIKSGVYKMHKIVKEFIEQKEHELELTNKFQSKRNLIKNEHDEIKHLYYEKIRALESERDHELNKYEIALEDLKVAHGTTMESLYSNTYPLKEMIDFVSNKDAIENYDPDDYKGFWNLESPKLEYELIEYLYRDNYTSIRIYIGKNGKPKNQYSLFLYGKSAFGGFPRFNKIADVIYEDRWDNWQNYIHREIKSAPTREELKEYYFKKVKNVVLDNFVGAYEEFRNHYLTTIINLKSEDVKILTEPKEVPHTQTRPLIIVESSNQEPDQELETYRFYKGKYYKKISQKEFESRDSERTNDLKLSPFTHIKVSGDIYEEFAIELKLRRNCNIPIGHWVSIWFDSTIGTPFSEENLSMMIKEAREDILKYYPENPDLVSFTYPIVTVHGRI